MPMLRIKASEFALRRARLMEDMAPGSIAIIPSAREVPRNSDVNFPFRQDSDFYYLTGFDEPDAVAVLAPGREQGEYVIFCRDRDPERELWDGYRAGPEGVCREYKADDGFPIDDIDDILPGLIEGHPRVYYSLGRHLEFDAKVMHWLNTIRANRRAGSLAPGEFVDLNHLLHDLRLFKSAAEIAVMRESGALAARAHCRAMREAKTVTYEYQLDAAIMHEFMMGGVRQAAYPSIVGGGTNACVLHYVENRDKLNDGDLVLIDAGADYDYYASDITRTFPVNGRFSEPQRALYQLVLDAHKAALEQVLPGNPFNAPHDASVRVITAGLVQLGLLSGDVDTLIEEEAYKPFYMHRVSHWLGMDVHDVGDYKVDGIWRALEPGMTLTIEPGIYVATNNADVEEKWRGIGIRIEDDIAVTKSGYEILTDDVPREVQDIEALMADT
ncbi:Xaa-Pro aminopeptidase [BD1-7 clade bacterium]|uniref:Xaa-Pro aminopeptidase n=1 Tax=BD1-7 clade bacterium TaxID=2029982 RepID=A0A5S9MTT8_9GAMM|nr:Xaa-Pro aminopeptidase [BD1-7 clade bacterium]CAA0084509.1 Xaa-Pro aminopeptidase [BD1-7 clade bacterium]